MNAVISSTIYRQATTKEGANAKGEDTSTGPVAGDVHSGLGNASLRGIIRYRVLVAREPVCSDKTRIMNTLIEVFPQKSRRFPPKILAYAI